MKVAIQGISVYNILKWFRVFQPNKYFIFGFIKKNSDEKLTNLLKFPSDIVEDDLEGKKNLYMKSRSMLTDHYNFKSHFCIFLVLGRYGYRSFG